MRSSTTIAGTSGAPSRFSSASAVGSFVTSTDSKAMPQDESNSFVFAQELQPGRVNTLVVTSCFLLLPCCEPTINDQLRAGHKRRFIRGQVEHPIGNFFRFAISAHGRHAEDKLLTFRGKIGSHRRFNPPWMN